MRVSDCERVSLPAAVARSVPFFVAAIHEKPTDAGERQREGEGGGEGREGKGSTHTGCYIYIYILCVCVYR